MCDSGSAAFTSDAVNLNDGYVTASREERKIIERKHYNYIAGFLTYLGTDPQVPSFTRSDTLKCTQIIYQTILTVCQGGYVRMSGRKTNIGHLSCISERVYELWVKRSLLRTILCVEGD